tara:strand:+ start:255 stop:467 length:213 start_codon:yes stop_codon:yes gene_type:complete
LKIDINEWLTYAMILTFVIGLLYLGFYVIGDKEELKEGEVVEGEKEIKEEILEDIEDIEDELNEIGDFIG